jgi:hypothetical protein
MFIAASVASLALAPLAAQAPAAGAGVPRAADGKPDMSGIWQIIDTAEWDVRPHHAEEGVPAGMGVVEGHEIPYTPAGAAKQKANFEKRASLDPSAKCFLPGVPRIMYQPYPFQIIQEPKKMTMLFEYVHATRNVYTDGTPHPPGHIDWWMGDSRGKWEGDTLVVDNVHFSDETWFDRAGNHHSADLHVVERFSFLDPDHINYNVTIEDAKTFTRPWKMNMMMYRRKEANFQLLEYECFAFDHQFHAPIPPK